MLKTNSDQGSFIRSVNLIRRSTMGPVFNPNTKNFKTNELFWKKKYEKMYKKHVAAEHTNSMTKLNCASRPFQALELNSMTSEI